MKRLTYLLIPFLIAMSLNSCNKDYLDRNNPRAISYQDVWNDASLIRLYVNNIYNDLPPGWNGRYRNGSAFWQPIYARISDEGRKNSGFSPILAGEWNETDNPMDVWDPTYKAIRKCNEFFKDIATSPIDQETKDGFIGEVKFLRAFFYFQLVERYGGVPLITEAQSLDDDLLVARNTIDECFDFMVTELTEATDLLPETGDKGRASKGAALAMKGRVLLYYASPLFNPGNDQSRWQAAAAANKAVMDLGVYELYPEVKNLFLDPENKESIFELQYHMPEKQHGWDAEFRPLYIAHGNAGQLAPVQELVDAFPMGNGKMITDPTSGYDPQNPYVGRGDRFYASIGYNGAKMNGTKGGKLITITLLIYKGGRDFDSVGRWQQYNTYTGYFTLKGLDPNNTTYIQARGSTQPWMYIRYAEVLLNYAEAQNEAVGPDANVYAALEMIRDRAGITEPISSGMSQDEMRKLIHNERYVELCFENKRYWDLRRWKLADEYLNGVKYTGVIPTKNPDGSFTYEYGNPIDPQPLVFEERMYWFPIPHSEILKDPNLEQNPGW